MSTKSSKSVTSVRFCNKVLTLTQAQVEKHFASKKKELRAVRAYHIVLKDARKVNINQVLEEMCEIKLIYTMSKNNVLVGTYSTANAAKVLARLNLNVYDKQNQRVVVADKKASDK